MEEVLAERQPPLYIEPPEPESLPVLPEHRLLNKVKELEGITYNTRQIIQEHTSKKKKTSYIIK